MEIEGGEIKGKGAGGGREGEVRIYINYSW